MKRSPYIADSIIRKGAMEIVVPAHLHNSDGIIRRCVVKLIRELTRENIEKLERLGVLCYVHAI